jgi:putative Holliday junction resolvase
VTRLLGLDVGNRRVGVAVGDETTAIAKPLTAFRRGTLDQDAAVLRRLADEQHAVEVVVGLPLDMSGAEGDQATATRSWADAVAARTGLPITWRDERLTTETAERRLGPPRRDATTGTPTRAAVRQRRSRVDREAAALILQRELDARSAGGVESGG